MKRALIVWPLGLALTLALGCSSPSRCGDEQCGGFGGNSGGAAGNSGTSSGGMPVAGTPGGGGAAQALAGATAEAGARTGERAEGGGSAAGGVGGEAPKAECDITPQAVGTLQDDELVEVSGMVASRRHPGVLYVHNDSGDTARFFAIDQAGATLGEYHLTGAAAVDWEDAAIGPGPGGEEFLYFADTGDNALRKGEKGREQIVVYRVPEPVVSVGQAPVEESSANWAALTFTYPDAGHDCEALAVDPRGPSLVLVTKEDDGKSKVFGGPALTDNAAPQVLVELAGVGFGTREIPGSRLVTGADISPAGDAFVVRTYDSIYFWSWSSGATLAEALAVRPRSLPAPPEPQAEAIAFTADGRRFLTVSEQDLAEPVRLYGACIE